MKNGEVCSGSAADDDVVQCDVTLVQEQTGTAKTFRLLVGSVVKIGRAPNNHVTLSSLDGVSTYHAEISLHEAEDGRGLCIKDVSKNGTGIRPGPHAQLDSKRQHEQANSESWQAVEPWQPLQRDVLRPLHHGWQVALPYRTRKQGAGQLSDCVPVLTVYIGNQVCAAEKAKIDGEVWQLAAALEFLPCANANGVLPPPPDLEGQAFEEPPPPPLSPPPEFADEYGIEDMPPPPPLPPSMSKEAPISHDRCDSAKYMGLPLLPGLSEVPAEEREQVLLQWATGVEKDVDMPASQDRADADAGGQLQADEHAKALDPPAEARSTLGEAAIDRAQIPSTDAAGQCSKVAASGRPCRKRSRIDMSKRFIQAGLGGDAVLG
eukprot:TRINITY_DN102153_c0_g1_i1.p1 TRINITY_DN102153_c0_g1~~TRINITY_DN102153_c0_g1_i1.p1  ORF type:complete len:385 (-),score=83.95 TRINITY_DN102153_c0_g1_i1:428-1558(-)